MVEDYKIKQNIFIVVETGEYIVSRNGRRVKNRIGVEYYDTYKFGRLTHDKWIQLVLIEVDRDGKRDLLEWIKNHCSKPLCLAEDRSGYRALCVTVPCQSCV